MGDTRVMKRIFYEMRSFYGAFVIATLLYVPVTLLALAQPYLIGDAVEKVFRTNDLGKITTWAALFLLVVLSHASIEMIQQILMRMTGLRLVKKIRAQMFAKIQRLPISYFDKTPLGRVLTRMTNDTESLTELFSAGAVQVIGDICFLIGTMAMLFWVNVRLSFASLLVLPFLGFGLWFLRHHMRLAFTTARNWLSKINTFLQEFLSGMQTVQRFSQIKRTRDWFDTVNSSYTNANRRVVLMDASIYAIVDAFSSIAIAIVLWYGMGLREENVMQLGVMVIFIEALSRFFHPIRELANKYAIIQSALVASERVFELVDYPIEDSGSNSDLTPVFKKELSFEKVSFAYQKDAPVLHDVSFKLQKNERIALVGHTGAGKSTITKLFTRFYETSKGKIALDGVSIKDFNLVQYRKLFNVVPQEVFLFSGTVLENLAYGRKNVSEEKVLLALEACQGTHLLEREKGLETRVEPRGRNFSLGERQILCLARALIADPEILILDEATASVDAQTEQSLKSAIHEVLKERTAVIVAHRLSTIRDCDKILVFSKGQIVESGSHLELMAMQGLYAKLVYLQKEIVE